MTGESKIRHGLIRPEDKAAARKTDKAKNAADTGGNSKAAPSGLSAALIEELTAHITAPRPARRRRASAQPVRCAKIDEQACISPRSAARGLASLKLAGVLKWVRRCLSHREDRRFWLEQDTNAYGVRTDSQWRGFFEPPEGPPRGATRADPTFLGAKSRNPGVRGRD